ncbi:LZTS2 protein, partial [Amia calva]|nr:LZTS2 protein [Amia calva]
MALVQTLPVPTDCQSSGIDAPHRSLSRSPSAQGAMGSVSSLISGRPYQERHCRAADPTTKGRTPGPGGFRQQDGQPRSAGSQDPLVTNASQPARKSASGSGNYAYLNEEFVGDWNDNHVAVAPSSPCSDPEEARECRGLNGNIGGPPPKLVPVSGKLEKVSPLPPATPSSTLLHHMNCVIDQINISYDVPCENESYLNQMPKIDEKQNNRCQSYLYQCALVYAEDKLRERELELQQLRDNLDENEAAICQVSPVGERDAQRHSERQGHSFYFFVPLAPCAQVYEEKQKRSELELEELRQSCAARLRQASQKAQRAQQVLQLQVFQLQQEKKKLQEDFGQLLQEREQLEKKCATIEREQTQLGPRLEETKWEVCQKSGEISLLKQQLKELQADLGQKASELLSLKAQLREARGELQASQVHTQEVSAAARTRTLELEVCENELQRRKSEAELLREKVGWLEEESVRLREALSVPSGNMHAGGPCLGLGRGYEEEHQLLAYESDEAKAQRQSTDALHSLRQQVERLRAELMYERRRSEDQLEAFEDERRVWHEEKEKVIRYQKQLQQNYIQMYRRNRELERVMRELSLELETRELEEFEVRGSEIHFEEITATEI